MDETSIPGGRGRRRRAAVGTLAATALVLAGPAVAGAVAGAGVARWTVQATPNRGSSQFADVSCPTASECVAVGAGEIRSTTAAALTGIWNGKTWTVQTVAAPAGATSASLEGVSCASANSCAAVGQYSSATVAGDAYAVTWNGRRWSVASVPLPAGRVLSYLVGVACASGTSCVAVGSVESSATDALSPLVDTWNGRAWALGNPVLPTSATSGNFEGVSCPAANDCTTVGDYASSSHITGVPLAERWNGTHWSVEATPVPKGGAGSTLSSVSCRSATSCMAVGNDSTSPTAGVTLAEQWNGKTWAIVATPSTGAHFSWLDGVSCSSGTSCIAIGYTEAKSASSTALLAEDWNGKAWTTESVPAPTSGGSSTFNGVSCTNATACSAVGIYTHAPVDKTLAERYS